MFGLKERPYPGHVHIRFRVDSDFIIFFRILANILLILAYKYIINMVKYSYTAHIFFSPGYAHWP